MKFSKNVLTVFFIMSLGFLLSGVSYADKEHHGAFIKLMNDSAAALQASRPDLAAELTKWSGEEANEKEEKEEKKTDGAKANEMQANGEAHLKLLRDSAAALQTSDPGLAAELTKTADRKTKRMADKKEGKEDAEDKEEMGGK